MNVAENFIVVALEENNRDGLELPVRPEKALLHLDAALTPSISMCGIVFVAGWHADTARHCSCPQDDPSIELMGRLRDANAVRG
jgi:hypothetical protein